MHASYGVEGTKKREFCVKHAREGMVNVQWNRYSAPGYSKQVAHLWITQVGREFEEPTATRSWPRLKTSEVYLVVVGKV